MKAYDINASFVHLQEDLRGELLPGGDAFWAALAKGAYPQLDRGRLLSSYDFSEPWPTWERHLAGEEIVLLLSGTVELVLEAERDEQLVLLDRVGAFALVPKGVWHTARTTQASCLMFVTPGGETQHRVL